MNGIWSAPLQYKRGLRLPSELQAGTGIF